MSIIKNVDKTKMFSKSGCINKKSKNNFKEINVTFDRAASKPQLVSSGVTMFVTFFIFRSKSHRSTMNEVIPFC